MSQCQALPMCTANCSHFLDCESRHGYYYCNCQPGFSGPHCNMNIDECSSSPCVNGKCVDGVNRYDCICNKGHWGKNCEKEIKREFEGECPNLPTPLNGRKSCEMFSGKEVCTLACNDGYSYDTETIIAYDCGPDTMWRWNGLESVSVPACSSKATPKEIKHHFKISMRDMSPCEGSQSYHNFRSAFEQEVSETLRTIHGCYNSKACVMEEVAVPGCGWTVNQRSRGVVADSKDVLFSLSVKAYDSASTEDDVEEKSEAILFQMQYAISTGQFIITLDNMNSTVNRSSFEHVSSDVICYPGFVEREDRMGCVACPKGTYYQEEILKCTPCSQGSYQDEESKMTCKLCGEGETTRGQGNRSKEDCFINRGI
ncbi:eye photoreceptor cell development [Porites harrisoni]